MLHTFKYTPEWEGGELTHRHWGPPWFTPPDSVGMYAGLWREQGEDPISFQTINQSHSSALLTQGERGHSVLGRPGPCKCWAASWVSTHPVVATITVPRVTSVPWGQSHPVESPRSTLEVSTSL